MLVSGLSLLNPSKLHLILNSASRLLSVLPKVSDKSAFIRKTLHWLPVPQCIQFPIVTFMRNSLVGSALVGSLSLWSGQLLSGHLHHAFISCVPICSLFLLRWHMGSDCIGMFVNNYTVGRNFLVGLLAIMVDDQIRSVASLFTGVIQHATLAA